jgi:hypothetical protein
MECTIAQENTGDSGYSEISKNRKNDDAAHAHAEEYGISTGRVPAAGVLTPSEMKIPILVSRTAGKPG